MLEKILERECMNVAGTEYPSVPSSFSLWLLLLLSQCSIRHFDTVLLYSDRGVFHLQSVQFFAQKA